MDSSNKAVSKVWDRHWRLAKSADNADRLIELLDNHLKRFHGEVAADELTLPADTSEERSEIINYIAGRLENEFDLSDPQPQLRYEMPEQESAASMGMGMM